MAREYTLLEMARKIIPPYKIIYDHILSYSEATELCRKNCKHNYYVSGTFIHFDNKDDALYCKLSMMQHD